MIPRFGGRQHNELRPWTMERNVLAHPHGSARLEAGGTHVLCAASVEERVPGFLRNGGVGWVTAEYSMLPGSTHVRTPRERARVSGRTLEIQRLIGRSLRCVTDRTLLGERTITVDCDVIQADGGTRTACITAGWIALHEALERLLNEKLIDRMPLIDSVAAVSVGTAGEAALLDLDYEEDSAVDVDMNVVVTGSGNLVELQATAERASFPRARMLELLDLALSGLEIISHTQRSLVGWDAKTHG